MTFGSTHRSVSNSTIPEKLPQKLYSWLSRTDVYRHLQLESVQGVRDLDITIKHLSPGFRNTTEKQADFKSQCGLKTVVGLQILYSKCTADRSIGLATGSVYICSTWTNPSL